MGKGRGIIRRVALIEIRRRKQQLLGHVAGEYGDPSGPAVRGDYSSAVLLS